MSSFAFSVLFVRTLLSKSFMQWTGAKLVTWQQHKEKAPKPLVLS